MRDQPDINHTLGKGHRLTRVPRLCPPSGAVGEKAGGTANPLRSTGSPSFTSCFPLGPGKLLLSQPLDKLKEPGLQDPSETGSPGPWGGAELFVGFKRFLKRLGISQVIYWWSSIYWPGRKGCLGNFSTLAMVNVLEDNGYLHRPSVQTRARAHTHTHALLPNTHPSGNAVFVFLHHLIMNLLAFAQRPAGQKRVLGLKKQRESQLAHM